MPARTQKQQVRRVPFGPLWRWCHAASDLPPWDAFFQSGFSASECAVMLDRSVHWVHAAKRDGLSVVQADRCATYLGSHPLLIWGHVWTEAALFDELELVAS